MRLFEVKITKNSITIRREAEERLTGAQKYYVILTGIITIAALKFFLAFFALLK